MHPSFSRLVPRILDWNVEVPFTVDILAYQGELHATAAKTAIAMILASEFFDVRAIEVNATVDDVAQVVVPRTSGEKERKEREKRDEKPCSFLEAALYWPVFILLIS